MSSNIVVLRGIRVWGVRVKACYVEPQHLLFRDNSEVALQMPYRCFTTNTSSSNRGCLTQMC